MRGSHRHRVHAADLVRLERWHRLTIYTVSGGLALSGMLWLLFHHFVHETGAFGDRPHALTAWWLRLHGGFAMLVLLAVGSLVLGHMRRAWRSRRNRGSGGVLAALAVVLTVTGYLLYYVADEDLRSAASVVHWVLGMACILMFPVHVWLGRHHARRESAPPGVAHAADKRAVESRAPIDQPGRVL